MEIIRFIAGATLCFLLFRALRALEAQSKVSAVVCGISGLMVCFGLMNYAWTYLWCEQVLAPIMHTQTVVMLTVGVGGILYSIYIAYSAYKKKQ